MPWTTWNLGPCYSIYLPKQLLKLAYTALIRSHLEYCSSLYSSVAKTHLKKLDVIQKKAARIIYQVPADIHAEPILILLDLDTLSNRREEHFLRLIKSFISRKCHPAMKSFVSLQPDNSLVIQGSRTSLGRRRPGVVGATLYNHRLGNSSDTEDTQSSVVCMSQVQGAVNVPDSQYLNYQDHAQQSATFIYVSTTRYAIHSCPALIALKEDYNNNNNNKFLSEI